jgi:drug/metabolite transporter (DMT)-like permease
MQWWNPAKDFIALCLILVGVVLVCFAHGNQDISRMGHVLAFSGAITFRGRDSGP